MKKVIRYFPALPDSTFFRSSNKEYYLDRVKKGSQVERMKDLMNAEIDLAATYRSNYRIYRYTNFPIISEITRWERAWNILCILLVNPVYLLN